MEQFKHNLVELLPDGFLNAPGNTVYEKSIHCSDDAVFVIARVSGKKKLLVSYPGDHPKPSVFNGEVIGAGRVGSKETILACDLNHDHALAIQKLFHFTNPRLIGLVNSFGCGDRLGTANPAHIRALHSSTFRPVLAQQSIRELTRTRRQPTDVMDAAVWAVVQEGYTNGFGADADHLKTTDDIDRMVQAGFTMFTIDPGAYVIDAAPRMSDSALRDSASTLDWEVLQDTLNGFIARYSDTVIDLNGFTFKPNKRQVLESLVKYGGVITHAIQMYYHLKHHYPDHPSEVELSVDETDTPTTLTDHLIIARELKRIGVSLVSLAPRFIGLFEKGVDFIGDLNLFASEFQKHMAIARAFGPYKLSIHSGSDKFTVYRAISKFPDVHVHIKTAGTSYLEAIRTVATTKPDLFAEIIHFSLSRFETDRVTYHISADPTRIPSLGSVRKKAYADLLDQHDVRQLLHVTFGSVLTSTLGDEIRYTLENYENVHYEYLTNHFEKHLNYLNR
jgi:hypothetical protein